MSKNSKSDGEKKMKAKKFDGARYHGLPRAYVVVLQAMKVG